MSITTDLLLWGWYRDDAPADEVADCTDIYGCSRRARWTHPRVSGEHCAQHAHQAGPR